MSASSLSLLACLINAAQGGEPVTPVREPVRTDMCEVTPLMWAGRPCLFECTRPAGGGPRESLYLTLRDMETNELLARFGEGYSLACAIVHDDTFYAFASRHEDKNWNDVTVFHSKDLEHWESRVAVAQNDDEHLFNSSVCRGPDGFVMAYETNDPAYPAFTIKFAQSKDLLHWEKTPDALFGTNRYTACPAIRYADGYYYILYTEHLKPRWFFEVHIGRSPDLREWELSQLNPVLTPVGEDEYINNSDPDLFEFDGKTYLYYCVSDQKTWKNEKRAVYPMSLKAFFRQWFPDE